MSIRALQEYIRHSKYAMPVPQYSRRETWKEQVERVFNMHEKKFGDLLDPIREDFEFAKSMMMKKRVLGSQRALQFGGDPVLRKEARIYNCLTEDAEFISTEGVKRFADCSEGDVVTVLTHTGEWKKAVVKSYGDGSVNRVVFKKGKSRFFEVEATADHTWVLKDGTRTKSLKVGDQISRQPNTFNDWSYEAASPDERLYWAYGLIYGDGTRVKGQNGEYTHSMIRLCGEDKRYISRFEELGFETSSSHSLDGDFMAYTGSYLKTLPDPEKDDIRLLRAFVRGLLDADGEKNKNHQQRGTGSMFVSIQQTSKEAQDFIRKVFPAVGVYVVSEIDNHKETNFGKHDAVLFRLSTSCEGSSPIWRVAAIAEDVAVRKLWCLEVEDDHSFVMPNGLVTGNCTVSYADRPRFFQEIMWLLLCGCGAGFSVQEHHVAKLPYIQNRKKGVKVYTPEDTIEGWSNCIGVLVCSYFKEVELWSEYAGHEIQFDLSKIREKGAPLSWGGKAPGPEPLRCALDQITRMLNDIVAKGYTKFKPIHVYDIVMHASGAVLAGGVRRSATISLFSPTDIDMIEAKIGDWLTTNPQRARSNNSVVLIRGETTKEQFDDIMRRVRHYGEPGFVWAPDREILLNPCAEIGMYAYDENGMSGWQFCNLCEINAKLTRTREAFLESCIAAAIIGTLQAAYDRFDYLEPVSERIVKREALLGVSMTGMMDSPDVVFDPDLQREGASIILETNERIAEVIGINPAARATCVKPAGNSSCVLGTASGIHPHHAKRYFRRVQANEAEIPAQFFKQHNERAVEKSVWSPNDWILTFLCEVPDGAKTKNQISAVRFLEHVKSTQQNWVEAGTRHDRCVMPWLRHNVSNTISVKEDEWDDVSNFIYENREFFMGISLLPDSGDKDYPQSPFTKIYTPREIVQKYGDGALMASGLIVDGLHAYEDNLWAACDSAMDNGIVPQKVSAHKPATVAGFDNLAQQQEDWIRRFKKFAIRYCNNSLKKCAYLLKDVHNWKTWVDLSREYVDIDWEQCIEENIDVGTIKAEPACSGGSCDLGDLGAQIAQTKQLNSAQIAQTKQLNAGD